MLPDPSKKGLESGFGRALAHWVWSGSERALGPRLFENPYPQYNFFLFFGHIKNVFHVCLIYCTRI